MTDLRSDDLSNRNRRAVRAGVAVILIVVGLARGLPAASHAHAALRSRAQSANQLARQAREILAGESYWRDSLATVAGELVQLAPRLMDGAGDADATGALTSLLGAAATRHRVRIVRLEPMPAESTSLKLFRSIGLRVEAEADIAGLSRFLAGLELGAPMVMIRRIQIEAVDPASSRDQAERLRVELTASALVMTRTEGQAGGGEEPHPARRRTTAMSDSVARIVIARNPLRADRRPAGALFGAPAAVAAATAPLPIRPVLTLSGVVLGEERAAMIEGLPGITGPRLMLAGQRIAGHVLTHVSGDQAVIVGPDTTWTLRLRGRQP